MRRAKEKILIFVAERFARPAVAGAIGRSDLLQKDVYDVVIFESEISQISTRRRYGNGKCPRMV